MLTTKSLLKTVACLRVVVRFVSLFVLLGHLPRSLCCPRCLAGLLLVGWLAGWLLVCWLCPWTPLRLVSGLVFCLALCFLMVGHSTWSRCAINKGVTLNVKCHKMPHTKMPKKYFSMLFIQIQSQKKLSAYSLISPKSKGHPVARLYPMGRGRFILRGMILIL